LIEYGVVLDGIIVGQGHRFKCKVRAIKTTLDDSPSNPPAYSDYRVMDSVGMNKLPDGDYEVLVGEERMNIRWEDSRFRARA
jgi:hypothetical protein